MKNESFQSAEVSPTAEIFAANQKIEDMIGNTDIDPEHLETALQEAKAVYGKYENVDGDAEFDEALDILLGTIENTKALEDDVLQKSTERNSAED